MKKLLKKIAAVIMAATMIVVNPVLPQSVSLTAQASAGYWKKDFTPEEVKKGSALAPNYTISLSNTLYKDNGLGSLIKIDLTKKGKGTVRFYSRDYDLTDKSRYRLYDSSGELIENGKTISLASGKSYSWSGVHYLFVTVAYGETADNFGYTYTSASHPGHGNTYFLPRRSELYRHRRPHKI